MQQRLKICFCVMALIFHFVAGHVVAQPQKTKTSSNQPKSENRLADKLQTESASKIDIQWITTLYEYQEPGWMEISGVMTGFRLNAKKNLTKPASFYWGGQFEYLFGGPEYNGKLMDGRPAQGDSNDEIYNTQLILGHKRGGQSLQYLMHLGLGYRYLNNYVQMSSGYEREQRYIYSPIYFSLHKKMSPQWRLGAGFEFDHFWSAQNTAHFGDADPQLTTVKMPQENGFGYELSLTAEYQLGQSLVFAQIFNRAWQLQKSQVVQSRKKNDEVFTAYEPKNSTTMTGIGLGMSF